MSCWGDYDEPPEERWEDDVPEHWWADSDWVDFDEIVYLNAMPSPPPTPEPITPSATGGAK